MIHTKDFKKILVVDAAGIGDIVIAVPSLRALRKKYPRAYIAALVLPRSSPLLEGCPYLDEIFKFEVKNFKVSKDALKFFKTFRCLGIIAKLRLKGFDLAVNLYSIATFSGNLRMRILFAAIDPKLSMGRGEGKAGSFYSRRLEEGSCRHRHEVENKTELISLLGASAEDKHLELWPSREEENFVLKLLAGYRVRGGDFLIGINPNAYEKSKLWLEDRFAQAADFLSEKYKAKIIFLGSRQDQERVRGIVKRMRFPPVDLSGRISLKHAVSLIRRFNLFITLDSGPMHIASVFKVPTVALFGPSDPSVFGPYLNPRAVTLQKESSMHKIEVNDLLGAVEELIRSHGLFRRPSKV